MGMAVVAVKKIKPNLSYTNSPPKKKSHSQHCSLSLATNKNWNSCNLWWTYLASGAAVWSVVASECNLNVSNRLGNHKADMLLKNRTLFMPLNNRTFSTEFQFQTDVTLRMPMHNFFGYCHSHNNRGQFQVFQRFSSSKLVLKTVESCFVALNYYGNGSTTGLNQGCKKWPQPSPVIGSYCMDGDTWILRSELF